MNLKMFVLVSIIHLSCSYLVQYVLRCNLWGKSIVYLTGTVKEGNKTNIEDGDRI